MTTSHDPSAHDQPADVAVVWVENDQLRDAPVNANVMRPAEFDALVAELRAEQDMPQPLLVSALDETTADGRPMYEITDGHHRRRAGVVIGWSRFPVVVRGYDADKRAAKAIGMNRTRGDVDLARARQVAQEVLDRGGDPAALARQMGYVERVEFEALLRTRADLDLDAQRAGGTGASAATAGGGEGEHLAAPTASRPFALEITFTSRDAMKAAKRALLKAAGESKDIGRGLLRLAGLDDTGAKPPRAPKAPRGAKGGGS